MRWSWSFGPVLACAAMIFHSQTSFGQQAAQGKDKSAAADLITPVQLRDSTKKLEQVALGLYTYADVHRGLPTNVLSKDKKPLLSWRVQILPYIEEEALFKQFKMDEPWDSAHNKPLVAKLPKIYAPVRGKTAPGTTYYQAFGGSNGWLKPGAGFAKSFPDGTSYSFLLAEGAKPVVWTRPDDLTFNGKDIPVLGGQFDGLFHAASADAVVRRFRKGIDSEILKLLIDPADGKSFPPGFGLDPDTGVDVVDDPHKIPVDAKNILEKAERIELIALDLITPQDDPKKTFHGCKIVGKTTLDKAPAKKSIVDAFEKDVAQYKGLGKPAFFPQYGIRATHQGKTADFVICFYSGNVHATVDSGGEAKFLVSGAAATVFNKVLKDAGIEVPELGRSRRPDGT